MFHYGHYFIGIRNKIEKLRKEKVEKEMKDCTFKPQTNIFTLTEDDNEQPNNRYAGVDSAEDGVCNKDEKVVTTEMCRENFDNHIKEIFDSDGNLLKAVDYSVKEENQGNCC